MLIIQDNDEAGAKHTARVAAALRGVVPNLGVVRFPELGPGGDLTDYFGETAAGCWARIERALQAGAPPAYTLIVCISTHWERTTGYGTTPSARRLELVTGLPGGGKSLLHCYLIAIVTTGRAWPDGAPGPQPGRLSSLPLRIAPGRKDAG